MLLPSTGIDSIAVLPPAGVDVIAVPCVVSSSIFVSDLISALFIIDTELSSNNVSNGESIIFMVPPMGLNVVQGDVAYY